VDALDRLRGLAVFMLMAWYSSPACLALLTWWITGSGSSRVFPLYVPRAFLLARILVLAADRLGTGDARTWACSALLTDTRIWPLYLVVLLSSWALTMHGVEGWHYQIDTASLWRHLALREGQSVLWSIPVEFTFYLWLPLLVLASAWLRLRAHAGMEAMAAL